MNQTYLKMLGLSSLSTVTTQIKRFATLDVSVLITGESGVGKEIVARALHEQRGRGPFISVHLASIPSSLVAGTLFGHVRGAFTNATKEKPGVFKTASGGTLFLDELGELQPDVQVSLLRVLQEREYLPLGADEPVKVEDVRIVAATLRDLERACAAGEFRYDLYYRLADLCIEVPPLRQRKADIAVLASQFVKLPIDPEALAKLAEHEWPGNVRELKSTVERALIHAEAAEEGSIKPEHLDFQTRLIPDQWVSLAVVSNGLQILVVRNFQWEDYFFPAARQHDDGKNLRRALLDKLSELDLDHVHYTLSSNFVDVEPIVRYSTRDRKLKRYRFRLYRVCPMGTFESLASWIRQRTPVQLLPLPAPGGIWRQDPKGERCSDALAMIWNCLNDHDRRQLTGRPAELDLHFVHDPDTWRHTHYILHRSLVGKTIKEAAAVLGCSNNTLGQCLRTKSLDAVVVLAHSTGGRWFLYLKKTNSGYDWPTVQAPLETEDDAKNLLQVLMSRVAAVLGVSGSNELSARTLFLCRHIPSGGTRAIVREVVRDFTPLGLDPVCEEVLDDELMHPTGTYADAALRVWASLRPRLQVLHPRAPRSG